MVVQGLNIVSDLKIENKNLSTIFYVTGYSAPNDGGGGIFYWNATSTGEDDGYNVIEVNGVATGRWIRIPFSVSASLPLTITNGVIGITKSSALQDGYLSSTDWNLFNSKQGAITLTTTGNSGGATLINNVLNVPVYTLSGLGGVPETRVLTINGTDYDLSQNRSWAVGTVTGVQLNAGTGISLSGTNPISTSGAITVTNTAPDQVVVLNAGDNISISGTYPEFTITASGEAISSFLLMGG